MRDHLHLPGYGAATLASHIPTGHQMPHAATQDDYDRAIDAMERMRGEIAALEAENAALRDALEGLSYVHDTNPSDAWADAPPEAYARHMLYEVRCLARAALAAKEQAK